MEKQNICSIQSTNKSTTVLEYLEIQITDSCNLNCKGCSHLAGLFPGNQHIKLSNFKKDMHRLKELFCDIKKIRLLGGEPFLIPDLLEYCKIARHVYPQTDIRIVTNGLLCLKYDDRFFKEINRLSIGIDISLYPPTEKIKDRLSEMLLSNNVRFRFTKPIEQFAKRINLCGDSDINDTFWNCDSKWCSFLRDGLLCICPSPFFLGKLSEKYSFDVDVKNGIINIHTTTFAPGQIKEFLNTPNDVCRYCTEMEFFDWEANKKPDLSDWIVYKGDY